MTGEEGLFLAVIAALLLGWVLVAQLAERRGVTAPMAFIVTGAVLTASLRAELTAGTVLFLAEITLALVLFHDASTVRFAELRRDPWISIRLLAVGFPLALALTAATSAWLLPSIGVAGAVLIAGAITPTDAGLGAPTILNPIVPLRARRALNVESGLNDGLATPVVLGALAIMLQASDPNGDTELPSALSLAGVPVAYALIIAVVVGLVGAWLLDRSLQRGWSNRRGRAIAVLALPLLVFGLAELSEANTLIAAFVSGLVFGRASRTVEEEPEASETLEIAADIVSAVLWFLAGGLLVAALEDGFRWQWLILAVAALAVLRLLPVAVSLIGTGFQWPTVAFLGWFGPRGVATIVFGLIAVEELGEGDPRLDDVGGVLSLTVLLSVFAHGITAGPLSNRYGRWVQRSHPPIELEPSVEPMPSRGRTSSQQ